MRPAKSTFGYENTATEPTMRTLPEFAESASSAKMLSTSDTYGRRSRNHVPPPSRTCAGIARSTGGSFTGRTATRKEVIANAPSESVARTTMTSGPDQFSSGTSVRSPAATLGTIRWGGRLSPTTTLIATVVWFAPSEAVRFTGTTYEGFGGGNRCSRSYRAYRNVTANRSAAAAGSSVARTRDSRGESTSPTNGERSRRYGASNRTGTSSVHESTGGSFTHATVTGTVDSIHAPRASVARNVIRSIPQKSGLPVTFTWT